MNWILEGGGEDPTEEGQLSAPHEEGQLAVPAWSVQQKVDKELTDKELFLQLLELFESVPYKGGKCVPPRRGRRHR